jgi:hypothetical protein
VGTAASRRECCRGIYVYGGTVELFSPSDIRVVDEGNSQASIQLDAKIPRLREGQLYLSFCQYPCPIECCPGIMDSPHDVWFAWHPPWRLHGRDPDRKGQYIRVLWRRVLQGTPTHRNLAEQNPPKSAGGGEEAKEARDFRPKCPPIPTLVAACWTSPVKIVQSNLWGPRAFLFPASGPRADQRGSSLLIAEPQRHHGKTKKPVPQELPTQYTIEERHRLLQVPFSYPVVDMWGAEPSVNLVGALANNTRGTASRVPPLEQFIANINEASRHIFCSKFIYYRTTRLHF